MHTVCQKETNIFEIVHHVYKIILQQFFGENFKYRFFVFESQFNKKIIILPIHI